VSFILEEPPAKNDSESTTSLTETAETLRWALLNRWNVAPQSNDRAPVVGVDAPSSASASVRRSTRRRKHQEMYKVWSQARHD
jgi:hypothetical protein